MDRKTESSASTVHKSPGKKRKIKPKVEEKRKEVQILSRDLSQLFQGDQALSRHKMEVSNSSNLSQNNKKTKKRGRKLKKNGRKNLDKSVKLKDNSESKVQNKVPKDNDNPVIKNQKIKLGKFSSTDSQIVRI